MQTVANLSKCWCFATLFADTDLLYHLHMDVDRTPALFFVNQKQLKGLWTPHRELTGANETSEYGDGLTFFKINIDG